MSEASYMGVTALTLIGMIIQGWRLRACLKCMGVTSVTPFRRRRIPDASGGGWSAPSRPATLPGKTTPSGPVLQFQDWRKEGGGVISTCCFVCNQNLALLSLLIRPNVMNSKVAYYDIYFEERGIWKSCVAYLLADIEVGNFK